MDNVDVEYQKIVNQLNKCCSCGKLIGSKNSMCAECRTKFKSLNISVEM